MPAVCTPTAPTQLMMSVVCKPGIAKVCTADVYDATAAGVMLG